MSEEGRVINMLKSMIVALLFLGAGVVSGQANDQQNRIQITSNNI